MFQSRNSSACLVLYVNIILLYLITVLLLFIPTETLKFYKILQSTGSDFSTMATEFPDRSRNGLKRKFKREEKLNGHLIDRILPNNVVTDEIFENVEKELGKFGSFSSTFL